MTSVTFRLLDPRPQSFTNEVDFLSNFPGLIIGLEVTVPALAKHVNVNIDPQHDSSGSNLCCIEVVMDNVPNISEWDNVLLVTVRPDLDAFSSMLIIAEPQLLQQLSVIKRLNAIALADKSSSSKWEPKPLFQESESTLAAIARCVSDFKLSVEKRLEILKEWLIFGETETLTFYRIAFEKEQADIKNALETGNTTVEVGDKITYVESGLRSATSIGYSSNPIVVAFNNAFITQSGTHPKYTICQFSEGYIDLVSVKNELNQIEPGWGGSTTIIGSPQGAATKLLKQQVLEVVKKHLL